MSVLCNSTTNTLTYLIRAYKINFVLNVYDISLVYQLWPWTPVQGVTGSDPGLSASPLGDLTVFSKSV